MDKSRKQSGFTLVELMIALLVTSIILSAVATLAYATSSAKEATDEMSREQSTVRHVNVRLTDLIMRANGVTSASSTGFELWHDTNADGVVDADETTWVISAAPDNVIQIQNGGQYGQCENAAFGYDDPSDPANVGFITIWYDLEENGQTQRHTINAKLRGSGNG